MMEDETPRQLGRYELVRRIAVGGMGEIYLARVSGTAGFEKTVIIKTILPHLAEEEEFVDKFLDEGRIVVNLTHGNIVPVFDMDEVDGEYFIAMDYVPGRDVREILKRLREQGETMPVDVAAYVISEVCEGLGYAHRKTDEEGNDLGIVHRDVSPSNVLISTEGEVKIIDFGIARAADRQGKTVSGRIQGKCCYMSPEQARGDSLDHRSDIFSAGVVFYEMLTGIRPFEGDSDLKSLDLVRECEFEPPSFVEGEVPPQVDAIVDRALAKNPAERYQSIDQMHLELMEYLADHGAPMTSTRVAEFLENLFPEGLEREKFQPNDEDELPDEEMDLDEALNYQLDKLDESSGVDEGIDPFEETQPAEVSEASATSGIGAGGGRTETLTPETGSELDGETGRNGAESSTPEPRRDDETEEPAGGRGAEGAKSTTSPRSNRRRWIAIAVLVLGTGAGLLVWMVSGAEKGRLSVETDPSGAAIVVDGDKLDGKTTPGELRLAPGDHGVAFVKKGYVRRRMEVDLEPGSQETLVVDLQRQSVDSSEEQKDREFVVDTDPSGAKLRVNQTPRGKAPQTIQVAPGETKFVEARKTGCERAQVPVYYGREARTVTVSLECESTGGGDEEQTVAEERGTRSERAGSGGEANEEPPARVEVTFASKPSGATVWIDGRKVGQTPVSRRLDRSARVTARFEKSDYQTVERTIRAGDVDGGRLAVTLEGRQTGCLNFFAVHPQYNELAIDGEWLDGRHQKLQHYELPAGDHQIRVRNPDAGRDETFDFTVEPGEDCTSLTVWDPDDG